MGCKIFKKVSIWERLFRIREKVVDENIACQGKSKRKNSAKSMLIVLCNVHSERKIAQPLFFKLRLLTPTTNFDEMGDLSKEGVDQYEIKLFSYAVKMHSGHSKQWNNQNLRFFVVQFTFMLHYTLSTELFRSLSIDDQCSPSYRSQSIDLQCRSMVWFLYDGEHLSLMGKIGNYFNENRMIVIKWPCTSLFCIIWKPQSLMVPFFRVFNS